MKKTIALGTIVAVACLCGTAAAQVQETDQQACINTLNKGMLKIATAQTAAVARCTADFAKAKNTDAVACYSASTKVDDAQTKNCEAETKKCTTPPSFGKTSCGTVNSAAEVYGTALAADIYGQADPNAGVTSCESDEIACRCQMSTLKWASKLYATYIKTYNGCKKDGLKNEVAPIVDAAGLEACMTVDPKLSIEAASLRLAESIFFSCGGVADPFASGDCAGTNGMTLADCVEEIVRCRVCRTTDTSDDLGVNCDIYDDGNINGSCSQL